jgi:hypothetical protein
MKKPIARGEALLFCVLAAALLALSHGVTDRANTGNDSYQYLSVAENLSKGNGLSTSLINFDAERRSHVVPAPLTTFPPGYAVAIAGASRLGVSGERAGILLSALSFIALFPLLIWGARIIAIRPGITRLMLVWLLANAWATKYPLMVLSESAFTAVSTFAVVAIMASEQRSPGARGGALLLALGFGLLGLAYWVRYAGLLVFVSVLGYALLAASVRRDRRSFVTLAWCTLPLAIIGVGVARNLALTATWQGGNTKKVVHPLLPTLKTFAISIYHLFFGDGVPTRFDFAEALLILAVLGVALVVIRARSGADAYAAWEPSPAPVPESARAPLALLALVIAIYCLGMIYLGVFSVISFGTRMFYPVLPLALLALGYLFTRVEALTCGRPLRRLGLVASAALLTICYAGINARGVIAAAEISPAQTARARFQAPEVFPASDGRPLRDWIDENVPPSAVIVATDAQPTGYVLDRRVVALTEAEYSDEIWSEETVDALMATYGAEFLILYPEEHASRVPAQRESPFLAGLIEGKLPPYLVRAARSREVIVFRRIAGASRPMADAAPHPEVHHAP